jgi:hypothetical protein
MSYGFDIKSAAAAAMSTANTPQVMNSALRNFGCSIASQISTARTMKAMGMCIRSKHSATVWGVL